MKSSRRSALALLLSIPLAALLLTTYACLPAPVGDPEQSKIDDKLVGAWQSEPDKDGSSWVALLRPWDKRTYYLTFLNAGKKDDATGHMHLKAWLTKIGDATFLTAEALDDLDFAFPKQKDDAAKNDKTWIVGRVDLKDDTLTFRRVNEKSWIVKDLTTRDKIEAAIKAQVDNNELYAEAQVYKRIPRENAAQLDELLKKNKFEH